ncbi:MAG: hypothetical protein ASARMPREDX12_004597 [Alectoria sarmentosa]|nr:MAG: hypothetical protein ASARMPRED_004124 [Alectoria sarmentosa]CAD6590592.1 MAG: hypothetical protein ASARMPREDX12_004597 [Alectoria sarmentosa]
MGAYVQGARDEEFFRGEVENEEYFEETEGEDVIEDETEDDELLDESGNERLFGEIGGEEPFDDENEGEEIVDDEARRLYSPQSIWPLSTRIWKGLVPGSGWEQGLPPPSQTQVDYNDYSEFFSKPPMAGQHARGGRAQPYMDDSPLPIAYNLYSPFLLQSPKYYTQLSTTASQCKPVETISAPGIYAQYQINRNGYFPFFLEPPGLKNLESKVASQKVPARKAPSSGKPATEESWPRASHEQSATQKDAAVGEVGSSQESATKKDSRGWKDHEKALVKVLMKEVISEGSHALTEERWRLISRRLSSRHSIDRTWTAVKNYWNRHGRSETNMDERKVKKPDRMITGVQDPENRKARKMKRKEAESDNSDGLVNLDDDDADDDDDSAPSSKRQRQY